MTLLIIYVLEKKRRSKVSFNFGQHYSTISARTLDIIIRHPSWHKTGELIKLIGPLWLPASSMTVPYQFHDSSMTLSWRYHGAKLDPRITCPKDRPKLWHSVNRRSTAPPDMIFFTQLQHLERQPNRRALHPYLLTNRSQKGKTDPIFRT